MVRCTCNTNLIANTIGKMYNYNVITNDHWYDYGL